MLVNIVLIAVGLASMVIGIYLALTFNPKPSRTFDTRSVDRQIAARKRRVSRLIFAGALLIAVGLVGWAFSDPNGAEDKENKELNSEGTRK